jgi:hypothetical protein
VSLRPSPGSIGQISSVDVGARFLPRPAARRQLPARRALVVEARGGRSWSERQLQQQRRAPQLPKIEDDGNPRFVIFIRTANVRACPPLHSSPSIDRVSCWCLIKDLIFASFFCRSTSGTHSMLSPEARRPRSCSRPRTTSSASTSTRTRSPGTSPLSFTKYYRTTNQQHYQLFNLL